MKKLLRKLINILALIFLITATISCETTNHIRQGDKLLLEKNYSDASKEYKAALQLKPDLIKKETFERNFKLAEANLLCQNAETLTDESNWEGSIQKYNKALEILPNFERAQRGLTYAKSNASLYYFELGLKMADSGEENLSQEHLRKSLHFNPDNLNSKNALDSIAGIYSKGSKESELISMSRKYIGEKNLIEAQNQLTDLIKVNRNNFTARILLSQVKHSLENAHKSMIEGLQLQAKKDLDKAIGKFKESLNIWPNNLDAQKDLSEANKSRKEAENLYLSGATAIKANRFEEGIALLNKALDLCSTHPKAAFDLDNAKEKAKDYHCSLGDQFFSDNKLDQAETEYKKAQNYRQDSKTRKGLAKVYEGKGSLANEQRRLGLALLHYFKAYQLSGDIRLKDILNNIRSELIENKRIYAELNVKDSTFNTQNVALLTQGIIPVLEETKPENLTILQSPELKEVYKSYLTELKTKPQSPSGDYSRIPLPNYKISIEISRMTVEEAKPFYERKSIKYQAGVRRRENPEYYRLQDELRRLQREYQRLEESLQYERMLEAQRQAEQRQREAEFRQRELMRQRSGGGLFGSIDNLTDYLGTTQPSTNFAQGFGSSMTQMGISAQQLALSNDIGRVENQLRGTPIELEDPVYDWWNYTVEHHRKNVILNLTMRVMEANSGKNVLTLPLSDNIEARDTTTRDPNPSIGIKEDPLEIPSDDELIEKAVSKARQRLAGEVIATIHKNYLGNVLSKIKVECRKGTIGDCSEETIHFMLMDPKSSAEGAQEVNQILNTKGIDVPKEFVKEMTFLKSHSAKIPALSPGPEEEKMEDKGRAGKYYRL